MRSSDLYLALALATVVGLFVGLPGLLNGYELINQQHGLAMAFVKFALLATLGESIGLRIRTGYYHRKGFGLLPRAAVWGVLGVGIAMAFQVFAHGVPPLVEYMGLPGAQAAMQGPVSLPRVVVAFAISTLMNLFFAPVFMTLHKITDAHIAQHQGAVRALWTPIDWVGILRTLDWHSLWHFVFLRTIPLFWIPMHTLTFCLPAQYRVLLAALLGVALGILLAVASKK